MSVKANVVTDALAEWGFREFSEIVPLLIQRSYDESFRKKVLSMSIVAGFVISITRTTLPHVLGYPITYHKGVLHGFACGMLTRKFLEFHKDAEKRDRLLMLCDFENLVELGLFINEICPSLYCTDDEISLFVETVLSDKTRLQAHPFPISREDITAIYKESLL